jgi:hypothetical protein
MKIVYFWAFFDPFLQWYYQRNQGFAQLSYDEQQQRILGEYFGNGSSYLHHARKRGEEAMIIITDCLPMQRRWAEEKNIPFDEDDWRYSITLAQVMSFKPDIVYIGSMFNYYGDYLGRLKEHCRRIVGWIGCPIPRNTSLAHFSLILSSHPGFVDNFRRLGVRSEVLPAAFDPDVLERLSVDTPADVPFSFVGSVSMAHTERYRILEQLVKFTPLEIWGNGVVPRSWKDSLRNLMRHGSLTSPLVSRFRAEAYGLEMYSLLKRSKITFNSHIDVAGDLCGNMRMYEATGVGTLLLTDNKKNLRQLFNPGVEVVAYDSVEDAIQKARYYLEHEDERLRIAASGQQRTLKSYSMADNINRMIGYFQSTLD